MSIRGRIKLIERIAQTAAPAASTVQSGVPSVTGSPTTVDIATFFPAVTKVWGSTNLAKIQTIINAINNAIYVLSGGQMDFNTLRVQYFITDTSKYPDQVLTAIIRLAQVVYNRMLTDHAQNRVTILSPEEKSQIIIQIQRMLNTSTIPDGAINTFLQTKVGNFKEVLNSILATIR